MVSHNDSENLLNHQLLGGGLFDFAQIWYVGALSVLESREMIKSTQHKIQGGRPPCKFLNL